jgi:hypothetical protein
MNLKDVAPSKHYQDITTPYILKEYHDPPSFNSVSGYPPRPGPKIKGKDLTDYERSLVRDQEFGPDDIFLMRLFKSNPDAVMKGWNLLRDLDNQ